PRVLAAVDAIPAICLFALFAAATVGGGSFDFLVTPEASGTLVSGFPPVMLKFIVGCLFAIFVAVVVEVGFLFWCWGQMGLFVCTASSISAATVDDPLIAIGLPFFAAAAVVEGSVLCW
ncbi:hypothetical protein Ancab_019391, partial [Ancistrocladus abbreviatus]